MHAPRRARRSTRSTKPRSPASRPHAAPEDAWTQREFDAPRARPRRSAASPRGRGFALTRRWDEDTIYVQLLAVHPEHAGQGLGTRCCTPCSPRPRTARRMSPQRRLRQPQRGPLYERVGMTAALAGRRLPEAAARLGRPMGAIPINIADHVGRTPMVQLARLAPEGGGEVFGKLEMFNPGGSVKDRIGVAMIEAAEKEGRIEPGRTTIVEATSGNTGIALAFVCAAKGYDLILTLPQGMSREREGLLRLYGAQVQITESMGGMNEAVAAARAMARDRDVFLPDQFSNPANPEVAPAHDRPGAVGGDGRQDRLLRRGRRHRRHDHRRRRVPEGAQPGHQDRRGRARDLAGALRRAPRPAQDPGHRRRLRPAGAATATCSTRSSPSTTRTRSRPPASPPAARACCAGSPAARRCTRRWRSPRARRPRASGSRSCCPTAASATSATPFFAPEPTPERT